MAAPSTHGGESSRVTACSETVQRELILAGVAAVSGGPIPQLFNDADGAAAAQAAPRRSGRSRKRTPGRPARAFVDCLQRSGVRTG
jgi:hypothetical protein